MREQKPYKFKKIYLSEKIFNNDGEIKLGYFNIRGFQESNHSKYVDNDLNLLNLNFLVLTETWLNSKISDNEVVNRLRNWRIIKRLDATDDKKHMGILLISPITHSNYQEDIFNLDYVEGYKLTKECATDHKNSTNTKKLLY